MKLSLAEISSRIESDRGRLHVLLSTERVIRNKIRKAIDNGKIRHVKFQKRRSLTSWMKLLRAAQVL